MIFFLNPTNLFPLLSAASLSEQIFASEDLGTALMAALSDHFRGVFGVRFNSLNLVRLSTPVAHLAANGRIKVRHPFFKLVTTNATNLLC